MFRNFLMDKGMNLNSSLPKSIFFLGSLQAINYIVPLLVLPVIISGLGMTQFGVLALCVSITNYFVILVDFGFNMLATKEASENRTNNSYLSELFFKVISIKIIFSIILFFILSLLAQRVDIINDNIDILRILFLIVISQAINPLWFFTGLEDLQHFTIINALGRLVYLILIISLINSEGDIFYAALITSLVPLIVSLVLSLDAINKYNLKYVSLSLSRNIAYSKSSFDLFLTNIFTSIYINLPTIIVGQFFGYSSVGLYATAEKIILAFKNIYSPISQAIYPYLANVASQSPQIAKNTIFRFLSWYIVLGLVMAIFIYVFSEEMVLLIAGNEYPGAIQLLKLMALLPLFFGVSNLFGTNTLLVFGYRKQFFYSLFLGSIFGGSALFVSGIMFSVDEVALSILITEVLICCIMYIQIYKLKVFKLHG